jgi:peptide deformylase
MSEDAGQIREEREPLDPEREARRRAALLQIRQFGDPVLRLQAHDVETFDGDLQRLVERMKLLMADANGVGLAANQVGILQRVLVMLPGPEEEPIAIVNPRVIERSDETEAGEEGCLSLQGVLVPVERSLALRIEGHDEQGQPLQLELDPYAARIAQHEIDHLDGVLIIDRTTPEARRGAMAVLRPPPILGAA